MAHSREVVTGLGIGNARQSQRCLTLAARERESLGEKRIRLLVNPRGDCASLGHRSSFLVLPSAQSLTPSSPAARAAAAAAPPPSPPTPSSSSSSPADADAEANPQAAAYDPVTGEINWDCPCLGGMADGPCGEQFKAAFSCFVYSEVEPKGVDCVEKFRGMQECFRKYPEIYGAGEFFSERGWGS